MRLAYDPVKNRENIAKRGLSFDRVAELDWATARMVEDKRENYGEPRVSVMGLLNGRLHVAIITRREDAIRVISFRKANEREVKRDEQDAD